MSTKTRKETSNVSPVVFLVETVMWPRYAVTMDFVSTEGKIDQSINQSINQSILIYLMTTNHGRSCFCLSITRCIETLDNGVVCGWAEGIDVPVIIIR